MLLHKSKKYTSMNRRLMSLLVPVFLTVSIIVAVICCYTFSQLIVHRTTEIIENNVSSNVSLMDTYLQSTLTELDAIQDCVKNSYLTEAQQKSLYENVYGKSDFYPQGLYYADSEGKYFDGTTAEIDRNYSTEGKVWFQEGIEHTNGFAYGNIYYDDSCGGEVVTASRNVSVGPFQRVIAANVPIRVYQEYMSDVSFFDQQGYTLLLDLSSGQIIGESSNYIEEINNSSEKNQEFSDLIDFVVADIAKTDIGESPLFVEYNGYYVAADYLNEANWAIIGFVSESDAVISETIALVQKICIIIGIILLIAVLIFGVAIKRITGKLITITKHIGIISEGNFKDQLTLDSRDEIGTMVQALRYLVSYLSDTFTKISKASQSLSIQSDSSNELSRQLLDSSTSQSKAMKEMEQALGAMNQTVEKIVTNSNELGVRVGNVEDKSKELHQVVGVCMDKTSKGREQMLQVDSSVEKINDTMKELQQSVLAVSDGMKDINMLSDILEDMSAKSKLLALNAAIEAARDSSGNGGFRVVANEMGNLSNVSAESVVKIKDIIGSIEQMVQTMLDYMEKSMLLTEECCQNTQKASDSFDSITDTVVAAKDKVGHVEENMQALSQMSSTLMAITQEQLAMSREFEGFSSHVTEQAELVRNNAVTCESEASKLRDVANELEGMLVGIQYKIES